MRQALVGSALAIVLVLIAPARGSAQTSATFDPRTWRSELTGEPTQVLVLATPHLSDQSDDFDPAVLTPLLAKLEKFDPDVITIENLSGESLQTLQAYEGSYPNSAKSFGGDVLQLASIAGNSLQLDMPAAETRLRERLENWPSTPTPSDRRGLVALFAASGDAHSALLQWWRLPPAERIAKDEVDQALTQGLEAFGQGRNESRLIGVRLAERLGLERVFPIDDHSADDLMTPEVVAGLTAGMREIPNVQALLTSPEMARLQEAGSRLGTPEEVLTTYRDLNTPEAAVLDARLQWGVMVGEAWPGSAGRTRMAEWEARNLRQAAHIREAAASAPGGRVLVIIGAGHKAWLEAYLSMLVDIELVDAEVILE